MPKKVTTAQPSFQILVANLREGSDPSRGPAGNPVKLREQFVQQYLPELSARGNAWGPDTSPEETPGLRTRHFTLLETTAGVPVASAGTLVVADNNFTAPATLYLGDYVLVSGEHFTVGGTTAVTATNLAAAINALPGFSAPVPGASTISISGPVGPDGNDVLFEAVYAGGIANFTLTPANGSLDGAEPTLGPPAIS